MTPDDQLPLLSLLCALYDGDLDSPAIGTLRTLREAQDRGLIRRNLRYSEAASEAAEVLDNTDVWELVREHGSVRAAARAVGVPAHSVRARLSGGTRYAQSPFVLTPAGKALLRPLLTLPTDDA